MYADDLISVSASVNLLQRKIDTCCEEAVYLDMKFNALKNVNAQSVSLWESEVKFMFKCRHRIRVYVTLPSTVDREYWLMTHGLIAGNSALFRQALFRHLQQCKISEFSWGNPRTPFN